MFPCSYGIEIWFLVAHKKRSLAGSSALLQQQADVQRAEAGDRLSGGASSSDDGKNLDVLLAGRERERERGGAESSREREKVAARSQLSASEGGIA